MLDILINQRMYAAAFDTMNDPMEGFYTSDEDIPQTSIEALEQHQKSLKFCSLSKYYNNPLMWAHYGNGCRGVAIGVEFKESDDMREVIYGSHSHLIASKPTTIERAKDVLSFKADFWQYEDEIRVFAEKGIFIPVKVKELIFGERADRTQRSLLKKIVQAANPSVEIIEWDDSMSYVHSQPVYKTKIDE
ncbi:DUF2971 domain-containing protein [Shewanella sp. SM95]|uniref:DUF2971 domain-containing protein n=1 Tax=Shewanella TaxID=22 RepID=UPI0021D83028|nr:DUF2971 domain-containing protein [Shewanella sp. SM95]MCU7997288.1 DUF2971 domain-containing protein [Shewanella sp. SM95]